MKNAECPKNGVDTRNNRRQQHASHLADAVLAPFSCYTLSVCLRLLQYCYWLLLLASSYAMQRDGSRSRIL